MAANCATSTGFAAFRTTATRVTRGAISLSSSSHFALKANSTFMKPVVLPPGRARLATQALDEGVAASLPFRIVRSQAAHQHADAPHALALLRARRERPCGSRAADKRYELASSHGSLSPRSTPYHTVVGKP